jgi:large subunit ribosomal protein L35
MPKMKTHRGAAKRFKRLNRRGGGKIMRKQAGVSHLLEHKPGQRRRRQQREADVSKPDRRRVRKMLGA